MKRGTLEQFVERKKLNPFPALARMPKELRRTWEMGNVAAESVERRAPLVIAPGDTAALLGSPAVLFISGTSDNNAFLDR